MEAEAGKSLSSRIAWSTKQVTTATQRKPSLGVGGEREGRREGGAANF